MRWRPEAWNFLGVALRRIRECVHTCNDVGCLLPFLVSCLVPILELVGNHFRLRGINVDFVLRLLVVRKL